MPSSFVFHDASGKRWTRFLRMARTAAMFAALALFLFLLSLFSSPRLPDLGLPEVAHLVHFAEVRGVIRGDTANKNLPFKMRKAGRNIEYVRSLSPVIHPKRAARAGPERPIVFGYYVNWDPASMVSLRLNLQHLTHMVPEWLVLENGKGDLSDETDPVVARIAADANLPILAMVTNFRDGWQAADLHHALETPASRENLADNILSNLTEHKFAGVNIDLEELAVRDRERMIAFMEALAKKLKPAGLLLAESVPTDDAAYDVRRLAAICDYIVPMVYDEHYQSGPPGPVASEEWFEKELLKLRDALPLEKTVIGFGGYGYDWVIGGRGAAEVVFGDVMSAARSNRAAVEWDTDTGNPVLRYTAGAERHEVWYLDAVTALNQVRAIEDAGFRGCALWRLGGEDPDLWNVLKPETWPEDNFDPRQLTRLGAQKSALEYGDGDVLRITETPRDGARNVWQTPDGGYAERYENYPSYYVVEHTGGRGPKSIALSFDDGPDPEYTPKILDILKARKVPAAFFVVGVNAEQYPDLVRREYGEGHEIGNHTYSHPNIAGTSEERTRLELTATERIIEHTIGVATTLFRPPYNADSEPQTPEEIIPILRAQEAGYITVGERIDPRDWEKGATPDGILKDIADEKEEGGIILLHDGGGDRSATIAALPRIIDFFEQSGYRFVSVGELIGKSRAEIMPVPSEEERRWARIEGQAFGT
ncbi:MAG: polysaccharide deacetylase family protein, partial [Bryobacteraceae bacterium]